MDFPTIDTIWHITGKFGLPDLPFILDKKVQIGPFFNPYYSISCGFSGLSL